MSFCNLSQSAKLFIPPKHSVPLLRHHSQAPTNKDIKIPNNQIKLPSSSPKVILKEIDEKL
jgi:hypothetical protein